MNVKQYPKYRKKHDWERLYEEWKKSGLTKAAFISVHFKYRGGNVKKRTAMWEHRLGLEMGEAASILVEKFADKPGTTHFVGDSIGRIGVSAKDAVTGAEEAEESLNPPKQGETPLRHLANANDSWELIQKWRGAQTLEDWRIADQVRFHIKLQLQANVTKTRKVDPKSGTELDVWMSTLTPQQIRMIADATLTTQRIQRLALGLSTDNIGVDQPPPPDTGIETARMEGNDHMPLFVVELTEGGKFTRARPRRVK